MSEQPLRISTSQFPDGVFSTGNLPDSPISIMFLSAHIGFGFITVFPSSMIGFCQAFRAEPFCWVVRLTSNHGQSCPMSTNITLTMRPSHCCRVKGDEQCCTPIHFHDTGYSVLMFQWTNPTGSSTMEPATCWISEYQFMHLLGRRSLQPQASMMLLAALQLFRGESAASLDFKICVCPCVAVADINPGVANSQLAESHSVLQ